MPESNREISYAEALYEAVSREMEADDSVFVFGLGVDDVKGKEVCSVTGSTSLENIKAEGAKPRGFDTYSECVDQVLSGTVDAMTTDGAILLGYAAEHPDELKVVVDPFSEERYGVGYSLDKPEMCQWIVDTIKKAEDDGAWDTAFEATLGQSGVDTPEPPAMDECPAA